MTSIVVAMEWENKLVVDVCNDVSVSAADDSPTVPSEVASVERDVSSVNIDGVVYDCELAVDDDVSSVPGYVVGNVDSAEVMKEMLSVVMDTVDG